MRPEVEKFSIEKAESCLRPIGKLTLPSLREPRDLAPSEWPKSSFTPQSPAPEWCLEHVFYRPPGNDIEYQIVEHIHKDAVCNLLTGERRDSWTFSDVLAKVGERARQISFEALEERAQIQEALNGRR